MTLSERYERLCKTPSSINELLPVLRSYAEQCELVAEFGVDIGQSTTAFLSACPFSLDSYDVVKKPELNELEKMFLVTRWHFHLESSLTCTLPSGTQLLFIDSAHCYDQIKAELERHHASVERWIICHDIVAYGQYGEAGPPQIGILPAIEEFLAAHPEWRERERLTYNNGLLVMERT